MNTTFAKIKNLFVYSKYKLIVIPSYRTPENILKLAFYYFNDNHLVIKETDKKQIIVDRITAGDHAQAEAFGFKTSQINLNVLDEWRKKIGYSLPQDIS